jgi:hypothetical protein
MRLACRVGFPLAASVALSACAIGNVGTLAAKVEHHGGVTVLDLYSIGLHLRTRADDLGAHLGYSQRTYVFTDDGATASGWHFLVTPSPRRDALAQDLMTVGLELSALAPLAGVSLGYSRSRLYARVPADASICIQYSGAETRVVGLKQLSEGEPCEPSLHAH